MNGYLVARNKLDEHRKVLHEAAKTAAIQKKCPFCNGPFSYKARHNKYCSRLCARLSMSRRMTTKHKHNRMQTYCVVCTAPTEHKSGKRIFCSKKCQDEQAYISYICDWLYNHGPGGSWNGVSRHVRRWLIEQRGEQCEVCGWAVQHPVTDRIPIQIDHIDGNYRNNRPDNLKILCPNCHSLTPTFGALNRGNGRKERKERYQAGALTRN